MVPELVNEILSYAGLVGIFEILAQHNGVLDAMPGGPLSSAVGPELSQFHGMNPPCIPEQVLSCPGWEDFGPWVEPIDGANWKHMPPRSRAGCLAHGGL